MHDDLPAWIIDEAASKANQQAIRADNFSNEAFERMAERLATNGVDMAAEQLTPGVVLKMDPRKETFVGNAEAGKMLTRPYRPGFVVPARA